jgi:hypothetical protein
MKTAILIVLSIVSLNTAARAAGDISPKFDGAYSGTVSPTPGMSQASCLPFHVEFSVKGGVFRRDLKADVQFDGFVTAEGFIHGHMTEHGSTPLLIEGRIIDQSLTAGAVDAAAGCTWTMDAQPATTSPATANSGVR